ncbi:MAG TPA: flippase [bacterium]|nr:flippase [bacterium]
MNHASPSSGIGTRITRYGTILAVSGMVCKIMLLVYTVLAVEILGREGFGRIEYFIEMAIIFSVLIDFGLEQTVTREVARRRNEAGAMLYPLLMFRLAAALAGGVAMAAFLWLLARPEHTGALILCSVTYFSAVSVIMLVRAIVRGLELMIYEGVANILDKVAHIGMAITLLYVLPQLPLIVLCYTGGALLSLGIYLWIILGRYGFHRTAYTVQDWIGWQKLAVPIGLSAACILLLHREDTVMVNWIRGDNETGLYRAPYRFLEGLFLFPQVLAISAYPIFSKLFHEKQPFAQSAADLLRGLFLISLPIAVGGTCIGMNMMQWLTPELGRAGGIVFILLLWSLPFIYANFLLGTILNATDRQQLNFKASAWGLASNAVLNVPAIYWFGAYGAAVVTAVSQGIYCLIMMRYTRGFHLFTGLPRYAAIVAACLVMAALLSLIDFAWYAEAPIGAAVYLAALAGFQGVTWREMQMLWSVARGR